MRFLLFVPNLSTSIAIPIPKQETHTIHMCAIKIIWQNPPICGSIKSAQVAHIHTYIHICIWMCTCVLDIRCGNLYRGWWGWGSRSRCSRCCYCCRHSNVRLVRLGSRSSRIFKLHFTARHNFILLFGFTFYCHRILCLIKLLSARVRAGAFLYPHTIYVGWGRIVCPSASLSLAAC